jgi:hypothetical protein
VRPHRHLDPPKTEAWIVLRGAVLFVTFFDDGGISEHLVLDAESEPLGSISCQGITIRLQRSSQTRSSTR